MILLLAAGMCPVIRAEEGEDMNPEIPVLEIEMDDSYSHIFLNIEDLEVDYYRITLQDLQGENLLSCEYRYHYIPATDYVKYYIQEHGFIEQVRFLVEAVEDGKVIAAAVTRYIECTKYWPAEDELLFGTDIRAQDISTVSWDAQAPYADGNYSYSVHRYYDEWEVWASYHDRLGYHDVERKITGKQFDAIVEIVTRGKLVRNYFSDPSVQVYDGSRTSKTIWWDTGTSLQLDSYHLELSEADNAQLEQALKDLVSRGNMMKIAAWAAGSVIGAAAAIIGIRRKKKQ